MIHQVLIKMTRKKSALNYMSVAIRAAQYTASSEYHYGNSMMQYPYVKKPQTVTKLLASASD